MADQQSSYDYNGYQYPYNYPNAYHGPQDVENPTIEEAKRALDVLFVYLAGCGKPDLLMQEEKAVLRNLRGTIAGYLSSMSNNGYDHQAGSSSAAQTQTPTLDKAELAIDAVIRFIYPNPEWYLPEVEDRQKLRNVKCALMNYSMGIPFARSY